MRPDFVIKVIDDSSVSGQIDTTARVRDRLLSLRITDSLDQRSNFLELVLDDRDHKLATPKDGTKFDVRLGYKEDDDLVRRGLFYYDETEFDLANRRLSIRARVTNFSGDFKEPKHRSFDGDKQKLGDILVQIAKDNNYDYQIDSVLFKNEISHLDQNNESDLNLVNHLGNEYGAVNRIFFTTEDAEDTEKNYFEFCDLYGQGEPDGINANV